MERAVHRARAPRLVDKHRAEPDESARRTQKLELRLTPLARTVLHVQKLAFPRSQRLDHAAHVLLIHLRR